MSYYPGQVEKFCHQASLYLSLLTYAPVQLISEFIASEIPLILPETMNIVRGMVLLKKRKKLSVLHV